MRIFLMTDLEGVAGVKNGVDWVHVHSRFYEKACRLLTEEVNAAVDGLFAGGATYVLVADGHGDGGLDVELLDGRADFSRGWPEGFPFGLDNTFDGIGWVGQHPMASSVGGHLCHTQGFRYIDLTLNGIHIGEFGQLALCAAEIGVPVFFASGDEAFANEARSLFPEITTCAVKRGVQKDPGEMCTTAEYERWNEAAVHLAPKRARQLIRETAFHAIHKLRKRKQDIQLPVAPPYTRRAVFRPNEKDAPRTYSLETHPSSVIALMNMPFNEVPEQ